MSKRPTGELFDNKLYINEFLNWLKLFSEAP